MYISLTESNSQPNLDTRLHQIDLFTTYIFGPKTFTLYSSCGILFPVWTPENISGLKSVVVWLLL